MIIRQTIPPVTVFIILRSVSVISVPKEANIAVCKENSAIKATDKSKAFAARRTGLFLFLFLQFALQPL